MSNFDLFEGIREEFFVIDILRQSIPENADARVKKALLSCLDIMTTHHSLTSRRYSLITLLSTKVDAEINRVIEGYTGEWDRHLLTDFLLSKVWSSFPGTKKVKQSHDQATTKVDAALRCAELWRDLVRQAIHSALRVNVKQSHRKKISLTTFCETLDTVICCIDIFAALKPKKTSTAMGALPLANKGSHIQFCELCWRPTQFRATIHSGIDVQIAQGSRHFCDTHNPRSPHSLYWQDLPYKKAFITEINRMRRPRRTQWPDAIFQIEQDAKYSAGARLYVVPATTHHEDVRRAAYAFVKSGLRGTREACVIFRHRGKTNRQIAAYLGVSERAVRLALKTAEKKIEALQSIRCGFVR